MTTPLDPVPGPPAKPKSDLGTRTLSAVVMVAVAGTALWFGGWLFTAFVVAVGLGVLWEWWGLVRRIAKTPLGAAVWMVAGVSYVGVAIAAVVELSLTDHRWPAYLIAIVAGVDIGAYFAGRLIGGPKIAPSISPSKTWAGLAGGAFVAGLLLLVIAWAYDLRSLMGLGFDRATAVQSASPTFGAIGVYMVLGTVTAIIAQSGDFFESWMKRRAGVKDSGSLIPGHGGLFDRVDGLLAVLFVGGVIWLGLGGWA